MVNNTVCFNCNNNDPYLIEYLGDGVMFCNKCCTHFNVQGENMNYEEFVAKRTKKSTDIYESLSPAKANLMHAALLIAGEAGELVDCIKKHTIYGQELDLENLVEEMGDLEFGLAMLRNQLCLSRETIISANEDKLSKRYKEGYSDEEAQARADKQELPIDEDELYDEDEEIIIEGLSNLFSFLKNIIEDKKEKSNLDLIKSKLSRILKFDHPLLEEGNEDPLTIEFVVIKNNIKDADYVVVGSHVIEIEDSLTPDLNDYIYFMSRKVVSLNHLIKDRLNTTPTFKCKLKFTKNNIEIILEGDEE